MANHATPAPDAQPPPPTTLHHGDCLDVLRSLPDASVDAIVTDPPYGLGFMGKEWDDLPPGLPFAVECLRVLKPGGHLLAFGGTRTWHRLACAVEDAGFEVRDSIAWLYGSGFPKSLDVSKAIDKAAGAEREVVGKSRFAARRPNGHTGTLRLDGFTTVEELESAAAAGGMTPYGRDAASTLARYRARTLDGNPETAPATDDARTWQGWGTALKPAFEPIVVARKPLAGTVAANVQAHGTGALNIDGCRTNPGDAVPGGGGFKGGATSRHEGWTRPSHAEGYATERHTAGRWPANVVLDESQAEALDEQSGERPGMSSQNDYTARAGTDGSTTYGAGIGALEPGRREGFNDTGGASRFFYVAKSDASERPFYFRPTCECEDAWPTPTPSTARATDATTGPASSSTSKSGSDTTGVASPRATRSTTSTATSSTTTQTTSSPSPRPTTSASTPAASSEAASGGNLADSAVSSSLSASPTGTSARKGGRSTDGAAPATSPRWSARSVCGNCGAPARRESHATVKPLALMRWLVRLVTPPGGTVLEPFAGSGTTVEACLLEGFRCIAIEREADYLPLIEARIARRRDPVKALSLAGEDGGLFDLLGEGIV